MPKAQRRAEAVWEGDLLRGGGRLTTGTGVLNQQPVTWAARVERPDGKTSPEELIAAAHAACYSMALSNTLAKAGFPPKQLNVSAVCTLDDKPGGGVQITTMDLEVVGEVPGLDQQRFEDLARQGEQGCPVSNVLRHGLKINLKATLRGS